MKCVIFADDSNLVVKGKNLQDIEHTLNSELENVSNFFKANKLKLNAKKKKWFASEKRTKMLISIQLK